MNKIETLLAELKNEIQISDIHKNFVECKNVVEKNTALAKEVKQYEAKELEFGIRKSQGGSGFDFEENILSSQYFTLISNIDAKNYFDSKREFTKLMTGILNGLTEDISLDLVFDNLL